MNVPSTTLVLRDATGAPFGLLRLAPDEEGPKGDCIFDTAPTSPAQARRLEVRWLHKRTAKRFGEHRYTFKDGELIVSQAGFKMTLRPGDDCMKTAPPQPVVSGVWQD